MKYVWIFILFILAACTVETAVPAPTPLSSTTPPPIQLSTNGLTTISNTPIPKMANTAVPPLPLSTSLPLKSPPAASIPRINPSPSPTTLFINGLPTNTILVLPDAVLQNSRQIFLFGQILGRDPHRFSKLGDSAADTPHFFAVFDTPNYHLGAYAWLQPTIDYFAGSFGRFGPAVRDGLNTNAVFDPMWADKTLCLPNETILACEIRLYNPAILLILLGTNDPNSTFEANIRQIVSYSIENGVVPVLVTKANRVEGDNRRNEALRRVATDFQIPLWDFDLIADTLPGRGLDIDNIHLLIFPENDYRLERAFYSGYGPLNLTGLMMLDALRLYLVQPPGNNSS